MRDSIKDMCVGGRRRCGCQGQRRGGDHEEVGDIMMYPDMETIGTSGTCVKYYWYNAKNYPVCEIC